MRVMISKRMVLNQICIHFPKAERICVYSLSGFMDFDGFSWILADLAGFCRILAGFGSWILTDVRAAGF